MSKGVKLLGNIKDTLSANSQDFLINLIARDDWRPNGGLPTICILLSRPVASMLSARKSCLTISPLSGSGSIS
jgi:hypothetical protein